MKMTFNLPPLRRGILAALVSLALAACSGEDGDAGPTGDRGAQNPTPETPSTETPDTESPDNGKDPGVSDIGVKIYERAAEYPQAVDLPLQFVTMSTGKKLSVRVTVPADATGSPIEGAFPVILTQAGYNTNLLSLMFMGTPGNLMLGASDPFIVRRGYVQVAVDALGTGASEGGWELFGEEEQTGFADMVDWTRQQAWSNGKLGVAGVSYMGISALFAAQRRPDDIDAVFASLPMGDAMRAIVGTGGLINGVFMSKWMQITQFLSTQNVPTALANPRYMSQLVQTTQEHTDQVDRYFIPLINDALNGESYVTYDSDFWRVRSPLENMDKIKAPTFIFGALHDLFQRDEPLLYEALKRNGNDARLVIYNGSHFPNFVTSHAGMGAVPPIDMLMLQWFDHYLRGMDTASQDIPSVVQYVKNYPTPSTPAKYSNDSFSSTTDWPHPLATPARWYLHGDGSLTQTAPTTNEPVHVMTNPEPAELSAANSSGLLTFEVKIKDGTECSRSFEQWTLGLALPETCFSNSEAMEQERLIFETAPMEEDYYINGPIQADIWLEASVPDTVVGVWVEEVSDNQSLPITNGQLLASVRAVDVERSRFLQGEMIQPMHYFTEDKVQYLTPGEVVKLQIEVFPTSAIIRKGNRLRIALSPSNQAQGGLNFPRQDMMPAGAITTLHNSARYPSSVVLPIVPTSALN